MSIGDGIVIAAAILGGVWLICYLLVIFVIGRRIK